MLKLRETFFSLIIDETTDVQVASQLAIMVQYWDKVEQKLVTELLYVVEWKDASAGELSRAVLD